MGFFEDDRIRAKNRKHQEAFDLYEGLKVMGYDNAYIKKYAEFALQNTTDSYRIDVLNEVLTIVRGVDAKVSDSI